MKFFKKHLYIMGFVKVDKNFHIRTTGISSKEMGVKAEMIYCFEPTGSYKAMVSRLMDTWYFVNVEKVKNRFWLVDHQGRAACSMKGDRLDAKQFRLYKQGKLKHTGNHADLR